MKTGIIILVASLAALAQAQDEANIDCNLRVENYPPIMAQPSCVVSTPANILTKGTKVITINSRTTPRKDAKVFSAANANIKYLPTGLMDRFPNLYGLVITNSKLAFIGQKDLEPFGAKLQMISLSGNEIPVLEKDLFKTNTKLKYINLSNNKITYIDPEVFTVVKATLSFLFLGSQPTNCYIADAQTIDNVEQSLVLMSFSQCTDIANAPGYYEDLSKCTPAAPPPPPQG